MNDVKHDQIARALLHNFLAYLSGYTSLRAIDISATIICHFCTLFCVPGSKETQVSFTLKNRSLSDVMKVMLHKPSYSVCTVLAVSLLLLITNA